MSEKRENPIRDRFNHSFVEFWCPVCKQSKIVALPAEDAPRCDRCRQEMVLKEILTEGKY